MDSRPAIPSHSLPPPHPTAASIPHPQFHPQFAAQQTQLPPQAHPHVSTPVHTPTKVPFPNDIESNKRRRTSGAGSRGVSNLTPEQLAKKRANDREAQRAIRERTKNQIDTLQQRIQELTSQKPYQELQDAIRQKELVQAENLEMKRRLSAIQDLIQPLIATSTSSEPEQPNKTPSQSTFANDISSTLPQALPSSIQPYDSTSVRSSSNASNPSPTSASTLSSTPFPLQASAFPPTNQYNRQPATSTSRSQDDKLTLEFLMQTQNSPSNNQAHDRGSSTTSPPPLPMDTLTPPHPTSFTDTTNYHALPVRNCAPTCPLDNLVLDFLACKRRESLSGVNTSTLLGPAYPNFSILLQPKFSPTHSSPPSLSLPSPLINNNDTTSHPISRLFTDMLSTFPSISTLPERVGILHIMFLWMRYQVCPTTSTYEALPTWMHPRASQLTIPHPAWTDYLPWPRMRDRMTVMYPGVPLLDFFIPYTTTISLNWPYGDQGVLVRASSNNQTQGQRIPPMQYHSPPNAPLANTIPALVQPLPNPSQPLNGHVDGHRRSTSLNGQVVSGGSGDVGLGSTGSVGATNTTNGSPMNFSAIPSSADATANDLVISPAFEAHLFELGNWSLGPAFRKAHPKLAECCRIKEEGGEAKL